MAEVLIVDFKTKVESQIKLSYLPKDLKAVAQVDSAANPTAVPSSLKNQALSKQTTIN